MDYYACPCCSEAFRCDKLGKHLAARHAKEFIECMPQSSLEYCKTNKKPLIYNKLASGKIDCAVCLACRKYSFAKSARAVPLNFIGAHDCCSAAWDKFKDLYEYKGDVKPMRIVTWVPESQLKARKEAKAAEAKPELPTIGSGSSALSDDLVALIKDAFTFGDVAPEEPEEDDEPPTLEEMIRYVCKNSKVRLVQLQKKNEEVRKLKARVEELEEAAEAPAPAGPTLVISPAEEGPKDPEPKVSDLRPKETQAAVADLPVLEVAEVKQPVQDTGRLEALQFELDELKAAYSKLYTEAMEREAELEDEIAYLRADGVLDPTVAEQARKVFYIDSDNRDIEEPSVNRLVKGVVDLAKEAILQVEKDQIQLKQYSNRIERLEFIINRDFS